MFPSKFDVIRQQCRFKQAGFAKKHYFYGHITAIIILNTLKIDPFYIVYRFKGIWVE